MAGRRGQPLAGRRGFDRAVLTAECSNGCGGRRPQVKGYRSLTSSGGYEHSRYRHSLLPPYCASGLGYRGLLSLACGAVAGSAPRNYGPPQLLAATKTPFSMPAIGSQPLLKGSGIPLRIHKI